MKHTRLFKMLLFSLIFGLSSLYSFVQGSIRLVKAKAIIEHGKVVALHDDEGGIAAIKYDESITITPDSEGNIITVQDETGKILGIEDADGKTINVDISKYKEAKN
jgi:hypothetical protein